MILTPISDNVAIAENGAVMYCCPKCGDYISWNEDTVGILESRFGKKWSSIKFQSMAPRATASRNSI